ncbi:hypothetical protein [uncultured Piscinibacter sp.]|uniref:hypothetical protein n=1 Tax=uncultured Piscinibacter sp. TaxID=1131835 RepID=UPI002632BB22|nr:hypothetical protein [uncultured Piscinibacter sp.]
MDVYTFSVADNTNIWAAVGAQMWAISEKQAANPSNQGKARKFQIGSIGLFYCVEEESLTTPFIVTSAPRFNEQVVNIWKGTWALPFGIHPFGNPNRQLKVAALAERLPSLRAEKRSWTTLFHVSPMTIFAASHLTQEDWALLVQELAVTSAA